MLGWLTFVCCALAVHSLVACSSARADYLTAPDGSRKKGTVAGNAKSGFSFRVEGGSQTLPLEAGSRIDFESGLGKPTLSTPPFHALLGLGQQISGRLASVDQKLVKLETEGGGVSIDRGALFGLIQTPGETEVFREGFESLDAKLWEVVGAPKVDSSTRVAGGSCLKLNGGGVSITHRLEKPVGAGRVEIAFQDSGSVVPDERWFVELVFKGGSNGLEVVRTMLGWSESSLAVESPDGPQLAIQRLNRSSGWHRLAARFGEDRTSIAVDSAELAYGIGPSGPLVEVRVATQSFAQAPEKSVELAARVDELRIVRLAEPRGGREIDPNQDEIQTVDGDQFFGSLESADARKIVFNVAKSTRTVDWTEVAGVHFRRGSARANALEGLWASLSWRAQPGDDPRDLDRIEGVLLAADENVVTLETPFAGTISVPRGSVKRLEVQGRAKRTNIDKNARHLGDEFFPDLFPPSPEGPSLELAFDDPDAKPGRSVLLFDVIEVVGEQGNPSYSALVKRGELRTMIALNGQEFDYINKYIFDKNESATRIRVPVPEGLLKPGKNVLTLRQLPSQSTKAGGFDDLGILSVAVESETTN